MAPFQQFAARFPDGKYLRLRKYVESRKITYESVPLQKNAHRFDRPQLTPELQAKLGHFAFTWEPFKKLSTFRLNMPPG